MQGTSLAGIFTSILYDDKNNCPKGHTPRIAFSPAGVITWPKVDRPVSEALYVADIDALLVESGECEHSLRRSCTAKI